MSELRIEAKERNRSGNCATASFRPQLLLLPVCAAILLGLLLFRPAQGLSSAGTVKVHPGDDLQALVSAYPNGTSFVIDSGVYRRQSVIPKTGDSFLGNPGAVFSGAVPLTQFSREDGCWTATVPVQGREQYRGTCDQTHPACKYPEDLFIDDVPQQRVGQQSSVSVQKWYLDYGTGKIYLGEDPQGHTVELSVAPYAFSGAAGDVTIRGLTIEKYADTAGDGAIQGQAADGRLSQNWVIEKNTIRLNHGMGIRLGNSMKVVDNTVIDNGQMGIGGGGTGILVQGNEIARNNYAGYSYGWEAGGSKFAFTHNLVVRDNYVHDNGGPGLWTDIENVNTLYEHNHTKSNKVAGILHEISHRATIRDNTIESDGFDGPGRTSPWYGGGIVITASDDVEIYGNTVTDCMNGIVGLQPNRRDQRGEPYLLQNLYVHDNVITQQQGVAAGIVESGLSDNAIFTSWSNRFTNNTFHLADPSSRYFAWMNGLQSIVQWQSTSRQN